MGLIDKLTSLFPSEDSEALWLYVQCDRCGTKVRVRVDREHDLQRDYDTGNYVLHKEIMDDQCFQLMQAEVWYDRGYNVLSREIDEGHFISRETYEGE